MDGLNNIITVPISVSARLIYQLGEQLISDEHVALSELIKNAYDADATIVRVIVDTNIQTDYGIGKIIIEDNGNGMIPSIINNSFLKISTSFKKKNRITPFYRRRVLGDKGLGRLSFQRLGDYINTITIPRIDRYKEFVTDEGKPIMTEEDWKILKRYNKFNISMDWREFEDDKDINEVTASLDYLNDKTPKYGTSIEIYNIKNLSFWNLKRKDADRLKNEIFGMINPFFKHNASKFQIYLNVNDRLYTNEKIDEEILDDISDVKVEFEFKEWVMKISIRRKIKYYERLKDSLIRKLEQSNFKLLSFQDNYSFLEKGFIIDLNDLEETFYKFPILSDLEFYKVNEKKAYPGDFNGVLYGADFSTQSRKELTKLAENNMISPEIRTYKEIKNIWESANGFYVFRNDFRILPYGKKDWAGFTEKSQTYKYNIYKEHSIAGYINIDGLSSENLSEQTNRQGIIEDEYGKNFLTLIQGILVELIVRDDVNFREGFTVTKRELENPIAQSVNGILKFEKDIVDEDVKKEVFNEISTTIENTSKSIDKFYAADVRIIQDDINNLIKKTDELKKIDEKIKNKNEQEKYLKDRQIEELTELLPVVGQGIIIESLTHELNRIEENIKTHATNTKKALDKIKTKEANQLSLFQQRIIDETVYLRQQLNHLEPTYRRNRKETEIISIREFIKETYIISGPMMKKALNQNVKVVLRGEDFLIKANRGYLITVFDNMFLNSLYWLNSISNKEIVFEVYDNGTIIYYDSGPGIHEELETDLFEPFKSMKPNGRGLGLYIVKELLNSMNVLIELKDERRNGRLFKFKIKFMNLMGE